MLDTQAAGMKERGKTWLARKLSLGKVAEKDDTSNQSDEDRVEIDQEDGRKNDATGASPPRVEQSPVIAGGGLLSYPVTPERGALAPAGAAAGSCDHERASPSTYNGIYPESTKSDKSDELKEHLDTVKSSLEEILASGYQNSNSSKATGTRAFNVIITTDILLSLNVSNLVSKLLQMERRILNHVVNQAPTSQMWNLKLQVSKAMKVFRWSMFAG